MAWGHKVDAAWAPAQTPQPGQLVQGTSSGGIMLLAMIAVA